MSFSLKLTPNFVLHIPDPHRGFNEISFLSISGIRNSTSLVSQNSKKLPCSINGDNNIVYGPTDDGNYSTNNEGMEIVNRHLIIKGVLLIYILLFFILFNFFIFVRCKGSTAGRSEASQGESFFSSKEGLRICGANFFVGSCSSVLSVLKKLRRYGISGVLSYGLLNTVYYLITFLLVWFYVAPVPGRMGYMAAAQRFLKVMAMVWAGSQVTKLVRAGGALALAPFVDRGLSWFTLKFKFESQGKASMVIVGFCFGLALTLFLVVTVLWA
ncbi:hypothetical protein CXB51_025201 [Gossypium anomalum]|uniref:Uncharacterized protein n=2 Tax=Gossypium TaxID=3633 RepID=A0A8J6CSD5_9ROSI|nr:hypothetical protein CXB51_025201 [Gossypium anomalum]